MRSSGFTPSSLGAPACNLPLVRGIERASALPASPHMTRRVVGAIASCFITVTAAGQTGAPALGVPKTPIGNALAEWLTAYNAADSVRLRAFYRKYAVERSMDAVLERRRATGGYDLVSIEKSRPRLLEFVAKERSSGTLDFGVWELSPEGQPTGMRTLARQTWR